MAIQDDLAAALSAIAQATTALNTVGNQATNAIAQVGNTYSNRIASLQQTFYVNQVTGLDTNAGTIGSPLRSIPAAIEKVPFGGAVTIILQSDYSNDRSIVIAGRFVIIRSDGSVKRTFTFGRGLIETFTPVARVLYGFQFGFASGLVLDSLALVMPSLDGYSAYADVTSTSAFRPTVFGQAGATSIVLSACTYSIATNPFGSLLMNDWPVSLLVNSLQLNGAVTSLFGQVIRGRTDIAGADAATVPQLVTNLAKV